MCACVCMCVCMCVHVCVCRVEVFKGYRLEKKYRVCFRSVRSRCVYSVNDHVCMCARASMCALNYAKNKQHTHRPHTCTHTHAHTTQSAPDHITPPTPSYHPHHHTNMHNMHTPHHHTTHTITPPTPSHHHTTHTITTTTTHTITTTTTHAPPHTHTITTTTHTHHHHHHTPTHHHHHTHTSNRRLCSPAISCMHCTMGNKKH